MNIPKDIESMVTTYTLTTEPHITRVKDIQAVEHPCEDCGLVTARRLDVKLNHVPFKHWRKSCSCGKEYNPITGEYEARSYPEINRDLKTLFKQNKDK